jgi:hypothetical protein
MAACWLAFDTSWFLLSDSVGDLQGLFSRGFGSFQAAVGIFNV